MNNFGIFKLLSSLYGYYNRNKERFPLSSLLNFGGNKNATGGEPLKPRDAENETEISAEKTDVSLRPAPINRQMLATMSSHDDFVKRVLKTAGKTRGDTPCITACNSLCNTPCKAHSEAPCETRFDSPVVEK